MLKRSGPAEEEVDESDEVERSESDEVDEYVCFLDGLCEVREDMV